MVQDGLSSVVDAVSKITRIGEVLGRLLISKKTSIDLITDDKGRSFRTG